MARDAMMEVARPRSAAASRVTFRRVMLLAHRWVGLALTVFVTVAGLTGSVLVFHQELDAALHPELYRVPVRSDVSLADPLDLRAALESALPAGTRVPYVPLVVEHGEAVVMWTTSTDPTADDEYFVDPYDARILGSRRWGDLSQGTKNLLPFVYRLHYSLGLGEVGTVVMGIAALLWTLDCFVGAYLTFPPRRRRDESSSRDTPRGASWIRRWSAAWWIRGTQRFARIFTWHRASGLWLWGLLFVFAWSAVGFNLRSVYSPVMTTLLGPTSHVSRPQERLDAPTIGWVDARALGRRHLAERAERDGFEVRREKRLNYDASSGTFRYIAATSLDVSSRFPATAIHLDGRDGSVVGFEAPTGADAQTTTTTWINQLHFGAVRAGGLPYRILVLLLGLAVPALAVTGVWIWWRRRAREQTSGRSRRISPVE